ncbi:MAG TPA: ATP-dependent DNA helicase [Saprospiraceae bacterium]|nr:ATP-dependent DNA helicase [Saprospiraceae bacterium]HMQ82624.1 ATP-dependent DNA helicase [Saprospiraceae bacterium]
MISAKYQSYNQDFLDALKQLNPNQRAAVEHFEGPMLVIAGPGTGKTHILSARIGRILMETDTQAQNILCLTFTDAGVHAMRQRLLQFIGPEAHRVHIYTFHSFCNSIIQDNLALFGRRDLEPISDLERVEMIRQLLDGLEGDHPLVKGRSDVYFYESPLQHLFQTMKSEGWTSTFVQKQVNVYLESLPLRQEFIYQTNRGDMRKGSPKTAKIEEAQLRMERLKAAAALFPAYQQMMEKAGRYDYDDMILWVLQAFQKYPNLLRNYQEQYLYFLIDEFQDTNGVQNDIIRQLTAYWDQPNLFIVGDDDQSIYEFQGARLKNISDFYQEYQQAIQVVLLSENYRSTPAILQASHQLIENNQLRVIHSLQGQKLEKKLIAATPAYAQLKNIPKIAIYPNRFQEETAIVLQLEELQQQGIPLQETAIIYARHKQADRLIQLLEKKGIPYNSKKNVNALDVPIIRQLYRLIAYFVAERQRPYSGEHLLFQMLHYPFFYFHPDDLARISLRQAGFDWSESPPWRDSLLQIEQDEAFSLVQREALTRFLEFHHHMLSVYEACSVPAFIERLINRSGLLRYVLDHNDKEWLLQALQAFSRFVTEEVARHPRLSLSRLLEMINNMEANRLPITFTKTHYASTGVNLLSAHSAKGLEFSHVFILDAVKDYWEPATRTGGYRFPMPDTLTYSGEEDALEARRRLFYVAMTRAKTHLTISYSRADDKGKPLQASQFVEELLLSDVCQVTQTELPTDALTEMGALEMKEINIPPQDSAAIAALLEGFTLSITALNRFLFCPLAFYYEQVLKAPVLVSEAAHSGIAMHNALQRLFEKMKSDKEKRFPPQKTLLRFFEQEMLRLHGFFSKTSFQQQLANGKRHLAAYYDTHHASWPQNVLVEYRPRKVELDGVPITGIIDRLDMLSNDRVAITDYKSGSHSSSKLKRPTEANPHGGSYWRQLVFYKLLYENYPGQLRRVEKGTISYLEANAKGEFPEHSITYNSKDVAQVQEMIKTVYERIQAQDFYQGCGKPSCPWCRFVQENQTVDSFADAELEGLDD